jgi:hypothetical protein
LHSTIIGSEAKSLSRKATAALVTVPYGLLDGFGADRTPLQALR